MGERSNDGRRVDYVKTYFDDEQTMREEVQIAVSEGKSAFKTTLICDCPPVKEKPVHRIGFKIYNEGNDSSFADEVYILCPVCSAKN